MRMKVGLHGPDEGGDGPSSGKGKMLRQGNHEQVNGSEHRDPPQIEM